MNIMVDVQYATDATGLPTASELTQWVNATWSQVKQSTSSLSAKLQDAPLELTIRIVDEAEGRQLNETWRKREGATNVLSFPFESLAELDIPILGDIVICAPVVANEASEQNKSLTAHYAHLVVHGTLHLLGYDHLDDEPAQVMEQLEINILQSLGYTNPYTPAETL
jgi:probable rRNA maturation factor